jgi:hypothetical protein
MKIKLIILGLFLTFKISAQIGCIKELSNMATLPFGMAIKDNYVFIQGGGNSLLLYELDNSNNPVFVKQIDYSSPSLHGYKLKIKGNYLYNVGGPGHLFKIFDITNPLFPIEKGMIELPGEKNYDILKNIELSSKFAYFQTYSDSIYLINTEDKANPYIDTTIFLGNTDGSFLINNNDLFFEGGIYDISNPKYPKWIAKLPNASGNFAIDTINSRIFYPYNQNNIDMYAYDISNSSNPKLLYTCNSGVKYNSGIIYSNNIIIQTGKDFGNGYQNIFAYKVLKDTMLFIGEFQGSKQYFITNLAAKDNLFFIAKRGGIEIVAYSQDCENTNITNNISTNNEVYIYPTIDSRRAGSCPAALDSPRDAVCCSRLKVVE